MPEFDCQGLEEKIVLLNLTGIMIYPAAKDEDRRRYWLLRQLVNIAAECWQELLPEATGREAELGRSIGHWISDSAYPLGAWAALRDALVGPGQKKSPVEELKERIAGGQTAGILLGLMLGQQGSLSSAARFLCSDDFLRVARARGVEPPVKNPESIRNHVWPQFRDAAHLWAAFSWGGKRLGVDQARWWGGNPGKYLLPLNEYPNGGVQGFLEDATKTCDLAIQTMPSTGPRKPFLDPASLWRIIPA